MFKLKAVVAAAGLFALPALSQAAGPTLTDIFANSGITESGYIDVGNTYSNTAGTAGMYGATRDSFTLHQVALTLAKQPAAGFGGLVNIIAGEDAKAISPSGTGNDFALTQAYVQYATGGLTVMGGRFVTLAGAEVINSTQNANISRSILFGFQPLLHDGVRASYKFNDMVTLYGGLVNSVGATTGSDGNKQKTIESSIALTPVTGLSIAVTDYYGSEGFNGVGGASTTNNIIDLVASYQLMKALSLGLNADHGTTKCNVVVPGCANVGDKTTGDGVAAYVSFQVLDNLRTSLRAEYVSATTEVASVKANTPDAKELTLTAAYSPAPTFDLLGEVRLDKSNATPGAFFKDDGTAKSSQTNVSIKAIYKF